MPCGPHNGAGFLFIPDLTNKATGAVLVVLIVLYVGTQLASSLMMSSPTMDQTQRQIMMFMPLFFVVFIINFPAGVLVYWITTNTWTIGQQYVIKRRLGPVTPRPPLPAATAAVGPAAVARRRRGAARPLRQPSCHRLRRTAPMGPAAAASRDCCAADRSRMTRPRSARATAAAVARRRHRRVRRRSAPVAGDNHPGRAIDE